MCIFDFDEQDLRDWPEENQAKTKEVEKASVESKLAEKSPKEILMLFQNNNKNNNSEGSLPYSNHEDKVFGTPKEHKEKQEQLQKQYGMM